MKRITVTFPEKLDSQIKEVARQAEVNYSAAVRMLLGRALGGDMAQLLVNEKVLEVRRAVDAAIRGETAGYLERVERSIGGLLGRASQAYEEPEEDEPAEEPEPEPGTRGLRGRRKPAKARRR